MNWIASTTTDIMRFLFLSVFFVTTSLGLNAQTPAASPTPDAESKWPGVRFQIAKMERLDATHLLVGVRINVSASAPQITLVGYPPPGGFKSNPTQREMMSGKYEPKPYSLTISKLLDETTNVESTAADNLPAKPYFGLNTILDGLPPKSWMQMGVLFPVPPPQPPGPDGKIPPQLVTFLLPEAKTAIQHVSIPLPTPVATVTSSSPAGH